MFSGQTIYEPYVFQFFNLFFTSWPIIIYATLDQQYDYDMFMTDEKYYIDGRNNIHFSKGKYWRWFAMSFLQGFLLLFFIYSILDLSGVNTTGVLSGFWINGNLVLCLVVIATNMKVLMISNQISVLLFTLTTLSVLSFFLMYYIFNLWSTDDLYDTFLM